MAEEKTFRFELGDKVQIMVSLEKGKVTGRADYLSGGRRYLLMYLANDGRANEAWFDEEELAFSLMPS